MPLAVALSFAALSLISPAAGAANVDDPTTLLGKQVSLMWVVIGAALVIFMQAGFALVETGFCRAKHAAHVMSTNFAVFGLGMVGFFLVGFPLAFGGFSYSPMGLEAPVGEALLGSGDWTFLYQGGWALSGIGKAALPAVAGFFLYMVAFMDTTATIPTGSMAERWKWGSFCTWGVFCGALYYPLFAAWTWGGGFLSKTWSSLDLGAGYADFAGSGVVHATGGMAALAGAIVLGPRIGKFGADGKPKALPGHHIPMALLGTLILLFGWFGFNAASTFAATDVQFATVALNTGLAAGFGAFAGMLWITKRTGKPDPGMMANGMLAGLVGVTAPCAFIAPWAAAVIGAICAVLAIESVFFFERKMKIDDPVGAISVHGVCGLFGVLAVGIFADGSYGAAWNGSAVSGIKGILYGEWGQLGAQALGVLVLLAVIFPLAFGFFKAQDKISKAMGKGGIRSSEEDEINGLDLPEMGVSAYPEFS
ncbi:MAG: ammonium transporter [Acidimicrobiia bacterium]